MTGARGGVLALGLAAAVFAVGLARITEVVLDGALRLAGSPNPTIPFVTGVTIALIIVIVVLFLNIRSMREVRRSMRTYKALESEGEAFGFSVIDEERPQPTPIQNRYFSLERVVAVGESRLVDSVTIEVISLEFRHATCRLAVAVHDPEGAADERLLMASAAPQIDPLDIPLPLWPQLRVEDDAGTRYDVAETGGGGDSASLRSMFAFTPKPPDEATELYVVIERLTDRSDEMHVRRRRPPRTIEGPWRFEISLR